MAFIAGDIITLEDAALYMRVYVNVTVDSLSVRKRRTAENVYETRGGEAKTFLVTKRWKIV